ncbi:hypothetical protein DFH06DRAFT_1314295 [Mycena polygramma]|nr:hypothetical protein DFH06DRAFT_1314295 [Mycena polygramma]
MSRAPSSSWEEYKTWSHKQVPELDTTASELVKALDNIAYAGEVVFLDFEALDLHSAYVALFTSVLKASKECCNYLVCCQHILDPPRKTAPVIDDSNVETALKDFDKKFTQLRLHITAATDHWKQTAWSLRREIEDSIPASWMIHTKSFVFPWLIGSERHSLFVDLPNMATKAEWHLDNLLHLFVLFRGLLKETKLAQTADVSRPALRKTIQEMPHTLPCHLSTNNAPPTVHRYLSSSRPSLALILAIGLVDAAARIVCYIGLDFQYARIHGAATTGPRRARRVTRTLTGGVSGSGKDVSVHIDTPYAIAPGAAAGYRSGHKRGGGFEPTLEGLAMGQHECRPCRLSRSARAPRPA